MKAAPTLPSSVKRLLLLKNLSMYHVARETQAGTFSATPWTVIKGFIVCLVTASLPFALYLRVESRNSKTAITVQAQEQGKSYFNFQDGRETRVDFRGEQHVTQALRTGQAQPRSLASIVLADDAVPDLIAGYAYNGMGIVTVQHGNPDAFAPKDDSVYARLRQGYNPDSLLPVADTYLVPESPDFLQVGDFNHDNRKDVLIAARAGGLFLLVGDGLGGLKESQQISLPGSVTAMTAGQFLTADSWTDTAVGVAGPSGAALVIFDGANDLSDEPVTFHLSAPAAAVQFGRLDNDSYQDVAVAAGSEVNIIHGWGRKQDVDPQSLVQRISLNSNSRDLSIGFFLWNRGANNQIAVLSDDGSVNILDQAGADTRPYSAEDIAQLRAARLQGERVADLETLAGWQKAQSATWSSAREYATSSSVAADAVSHSVLFKLHISSQETDDLITLDQSQNKLNVVRQINSNAGTTAQSLSAAGDLTNTSLDTTEAPIAVLALPQKLNGEGSLVVMQAQSASPTIVPLVPTAIMNVNRTDDPSGGALAAASVCNGGAGDCSLRGAVQKANIPANSGSTINIPAGTYTLAINGVTTDGCDGNTVGDLGINNTTTISGDGAATTIIRQSGTAPGSTGDRVICLNETIQNSKVYSFSGISIIGGRSSTFFGGAGIIGGGHLNGLTLTGVTIANNQATGAGTANGGGGVQHVAGNVTITNSTFGGTTNPGAPGDRTTVTAGNSMSTSSGGGLSFNPSSTSNSGEVSTLTVTGTTFSRNTAGGGGGGAVDLFVLSYNNNGPGTGSFSFSGCTFSNNAATATGGNGGAILNETFNGSVATSSFTSNSAGPAAVMGGVGHGGAIQVGGGLGFHLDGTSPSLTFTGNTAANGTSVSANGLVTVSGTNTTIGGSVEVLTNGTWTNNAGSALNPTDVNVLGGTFNANNSTMNLSGNLTIAPETTKGAIFNANTGTVNIQGNMSVNLNNGGSGAVGQFNAGTGLFNFNGTLAQAINGPSSPTFNNLTVNKTGILTLNVSTPIAGSLTVTAGTLDLLGNAANRTAAGGTLTVSNGATLKIGGTGTLPSNFTTHSIGATSTIEYAGTNQTVATLNSAQKYGNLIISGSGTKTLQGAISVATSLTINGGTLDASASNFNIDNAGNWINNVAAANFNPRAATVTFSSGAQTIGGTAAIQTFNNVTMNNTSLTVVGSTTTLNINGNLTLTAGVFTAGTAANINIAGNWTNNIGPAGFVPGTGTVTFNSTTAGQQINGSAASQTFNNLTVTKAGQILSTGGSTTQLDLNGTFNLTAGTVTAPATINVAGDWTVATGAIFTPGAGTVNFTGAGARVINGTATTQAFNNLVINKSGGGSVTNGGSATTLSVAGGVTLTQGSFAPNAATVSLAGNWTNNGGTFTPGTSTVLFNSGAAPQSITGTAATQTFNNITVLKSAQSLSVAGSTTTLNVNGNMNIASGNFNVGTAASVNVGGNWTLDNTATFTAGAGTNTVTFNGTGAQSLNGTSTTQTFNNFTVSKTAGTLSVGGSLATLNVANFSITQGTFAAGAATINLAGNWSNLGTFTANTSTVVFNGNAVPQTISGNTTFNNLTINHTGAGNVDASSSTLAVTGLLRIQQGTFISSSQFNNVQIDSGTTLQGSNGTTMSVSGNWTNNGGTFTPSGNTVNFNGAGAQTIGGTSTSQTFDNFTVNKAGGTLSVGGSTTALDINGNVTLTLGTFAAGTATNITVAGNWTNNATFTPGAGTVVFDGANNTQTLAGSTTFNNLTINHTGTGGVTASGSTLAVTSLLRVQAGTFTSSSTFNNVQIDIGATLAGTNATTMNVSGNWTNNGGSSTSFTANGNTLNFNGAGAQTIGGNTVTTFNNLTIANAGGGVSLGLNAIVNGTLTLTNDLNTGANTLIQPSTAPVSAGARDIIGNVQRTNSPSSLPLSTALTFGNPFNRITFDSGTPPTDVTINLVKTAPGDFPTAVTRTYTITPNGGAAFTSTLQLHYLDAELNGNTEFILNLWRKDGATWNNQGAFNHDPTNNWVRQINVTQFSPWTFANGAPTAADGVITGRITDSNGAPVEGAVVRLEGTQNRKFITDLNGVYRFEKVETNGFYTVTPSRANYTFNPAVRSFSQVGQSTEAAFGAIAATSGFVNPLDTPEYFVRQHYLDFLGREPDEAGFNFWSDEIIACGADQDCIGRKRENVSAAYFLSIEFQATGGLVDGLYRASYGARPQFSQFMPDTLALAAGVVVGREGWQAKLQANKEAFIAAFVNRPAFHALYDGLASSDYVDALISHAGVSFTPAEREALIGMTRAEALSTIAENDSFKSAKFNDAFVMMEYFGYLRRDADPSGFQYWLNKLNQFGGNFEQAEMVKAFIVSGEYRERFAR